MKIKEIMTTNPKVIPLNATLKQAATEMEKNDFGFLPIGDLGHIEGVITDRDMTIRGLTKGDADLSVEDIMTKNVIACLEDDDVDSAAQKMSEAQLHRLIVLDKNNKISGVISLGDIARKNKDSELCAKTFQAISQK